MSDGGAEPELYQRKVKCDVKRSTDRNDPVLSQCRLIEFVSYSKGRGRKRKFPIDVQLLQYNGKCYTLTDVPTNGLDIVAKEILEGSIQPGEDEFKVLMRHLASARPR